ncbi:serine hydrolase domain-containing protein [Thomasclavelia spiroformis]|uniref:serine hydrolase domain-containing protein n=1 Tax=Thomasclavelia spiroformis TaxID=29348 RepID=UPI0013A64997|nr:serine hydrolase [Thomasclavelia spiroformis]
MKRVVKMNDNLKKKFEELIVDKRMASALCVTFGNENNDYFYCGGRLAEDDINKTNINSIFDLSSISKFFTLIIVFKVIELGMLSLDDTITDIDQRFINLNSITIGDLLSYQFELKTSERLEKCSNIEELEHLLFNVTFSQNKGIYSDIPAMIIRILIEKIMNEDFFSLIEKWIIKPCKLENTYINIPDDMLSNTVSNNFEHRIIKNRFITYDHITRGICNDGKSQVFKNIKFAGHAGIFSSISDMSKLCKKFLNYELLSKKNVFSLGINRTGEKINGNYTKFFGYLCYSKHPIRIYSEVNHQLSEKTIAFGGYTGNQLTIDPVNNIYIFMAANRCHNRVTQIIPKADSNKYIKMMNGSKTIQHQGITYIYTKDFVYARDENVIDPIVEYLLS